MPADKIDVRQISYYATVHANQREAAGSESWMQLYDEHFARLVMKECAKKVLEGVCHCSNAAESGRLYRAAEVIEEWMP